MHASEKKNIDKVISGTTTKENAREIADWFSSSVEGQQFLSDMLDKDAYLLEHELNTDFLPNELQSEKILSEINRKILKSTILKISLRVAAVFLPLLILAGLTFYISKQVDLFGTSEFAEIYAPKGERIRLFFHDGTEVFLNADSKIRYPKKFGLSKRKVFLDGEAYFNVVSNKKRPFIVYTEKSSVSVLGTSFNVNAYRTEREIKVVLDEGKVMFNTGGNSYSIKPGQKFIFDKVSGEAKVANLTNSIDESMWRENYIRLKDTPLVETLNILDRQFNVPFRIIDANAGLYSFTLTTKEKPLSFILDELHKIAPLEFIQKNDTVFVKTKR